jgi:hypothetical protein
MKKLAALVLGTVFLAGAAQASDYGCGGVSASVTTPDTVASSTPTPDQDKTVAPKS